MRVTIQLEEISNGVILGQEDGFLGEQEGPQAVYCETLAEAKAKIGDYAEALLNWRKTAEQRRSAELAQERAQMAQFRGGVVACGNSSDAFAGDDIANAAGSIA